MSKSNRLERGLQDAVAYAKGSSNRGRRTNYKIPENIDVRAIREKLDLSQTEFALRFGFSLGTLRHWEQGRRYPEGAARAFLAVIAEAPKVVERVLEKVERNSIPVADPEPIPRIRSVK